MARTQIRGVRILDGSIQRDDLNVDVAGQAVIRRLIAGSNITIDSSTGVDSGTGDVTISATLPPGSGNTLWSGSGAPSAETGSDNDFYIDTANGKLYKKISSAWEEQMDFVIETEDYGNYFFISSGAPTAETGIDDDVYLDLSNGKVYKKLSGTWTEQVDLATQAEADAVSNEEAAFSIAMAIVFGGR